MEEVVADDEAEVDIALKLVAVASGTFDIAAVADVLSSIVLIIRSFQNPARRSDLPPN